LAGFGLEKPNSGLDPGETFFLTALAISIAPRPFKFREISVSISTRSLVFSTHRFDYREKKNVGRTSPIRLNALYSIGWSGAEIETQVFKMAAKFRDKRT
jgi:hypothetical protein